MNFSTLLDILGTLDFHEERDKVLLLDYIRHLEKQFPDPREKTQLHMLLRSHIDKYTSFNGTIFYHPILLLNAIIHSDILGSKISHTEFFDLYRSLQSFEAYKAHCDHFLQELSEKYAIQIESISSPITRNHITATPLDCHLLISHIPLIYKHISFYPEIFITNIHLKKICIAQAFSQNNSHEGPIHLGGFQTNEDNNVYLALHSISQSIHHEIYHQAMQYYNDINQRGNLRKIKDYFVSYHVNKQETTGYACHYGRENISEDQATVAEFLIRDYDRMMHRSKTDKILAKKIELVLSAYLELSAGIMTKEYIAHESKELKDSSK